MCVDVESSHGLVAANGHNFGNCAAHLKEAADAFVPQVVKADLDARTIFDALPSEFYGGLCHIAQYPALRTIKPL